MADENPTPNFVVDQRLLGRQVNEMRLRIGQLEGRVNEIGRDVKVLMLMAQNQDEALKEMRNQFGEILAALTMAVERVERRLDLMGG